MLREPQSALAELFPFLGLGAPTSSRARKRLSCAATNADHPRVHRAASPLTVEVAFAMMPTGHACELLQIAGQLEATRRMMNELGYLTPLPSSHSAPGECALGVAPRVSCKGGKAVTCPLRL